MGQYNKKNLKQQSLSQVTVKRYLFGVLIHKFFFQGGLSVYRLYDIRLPYSGQTLLYFGSHEWG
jgi:hypothetical protein